MRFTAPVALLAGLAAAQDSTVTDVITSTTRQLVTITQCHPTLTDCPLSSSSSTPVETTSEVSSPVETSSWTQPATNSTAAQSTTVSPSATVVPGSGAVRLHSGAMAAVAAAAVALAF